MEPWQNKIRSEIFAEQSNWKELVVAEHADLKRKLDKLELFLNIMGDPEAPVLNTTQQVLLLCQEHTMRNYLHILALRLSDTVNKKDEP